MKATSPRAGGHESPNKVAYHLFVFWRNTQVRDVWALVVGLVVYSVLTVIPFIGGLVTLFVILFGLGAILLADRGLYVAAREKEIV